MACLASRHQWLHLKLVKGTLIVGDFFFKKKKEERRKGNKGLRTCDEVLADAHSKSTSQKKRASSKSVNAIESRESRDRVDDVCNDLENKCAGQLLDVLGEVGRAVVNDKVDTDKLL